MLESYFLNSQPKTEFELIVQINLVFWLLQVPPTESKAHQDFLTSYPNFYQDKNKNSINWSSDNLFFKEKIKKLIDLLKSIKIDFNLPSTPENLPPFQELVNLTMKKIENNLKKTYTGTIEFEGHPLNSITLKSISEIFYFNNIDFFKSKNFLSERNKLVQNILNISEIYAAQITKKYHLVEFFSCELEQINTRLEAVTEKHFPLFEKYKNEELLKNSFEPLKNSIIKSYQLTDDQYKILFEYKKLIETEKKSIFYFMNDQEIKSLTNKLADKKRTLELAWEATFATRSELDQLLELEKPLQKISLTLKNLKIKNFSSSVEQAEDILDQITFILTHPSTFRPSYFESKRIPRALINLVLENISRPIHQIQDTLNNFVLSNKSFSSRINSSNILKDIQGLLDLIKSIRNTIIDKDTNFEKIIPAIKPSHKSLDEKQAIHSKAPVSPIIAGEASNSATQLFLNDASPNISHLKFEGWYHPEICHYLLQLVINQAQCLRVVFPDAGYDNNTYTFKNQLKQLVLLETHLDCPALFISKEPGMDNHFICGLIKNKKLLLINPLGITDKVICYEILSELKQEKIIESVWLSLNQLQKHDYEEQGLVSCGPIIVELATHILSSFTPAALDTFLSEQLDMNNSMTHLQSRLKFYSIDCTTLLPQTLKKLADILNELSYRTVVEDIRKSHYLKLQTLPLERALR